MSMLIILVLGLLQCGGGSIGAILRGTRVKSGQFPWLVQFQTIVPCGGILVAPDWVLTAAQCVQYKRNSITLYAAGLNGTGSGQTVSIKATYIFPQYKAYSKINDREHNIALLKLSQSFDICDDTVQLVAVAPVAPNNDYKNCLIFGWQSYVAPSAKVLAKPIQYSHVIPNTWIFCMNIFKGNISYTNVFCVMTESEDRIAACAGNPGSPVVCEDQYHRMILLGIASWSNFSLECEGLPTYLRVSDFRSWMYDLILNDKKLEEWDKGSKYSKGTCEYRGHFGGMLSETDTRNYSHLSVSDYQRRTNHRTAVDEERVNRIWQPLKLEQEDHLQASTFSVLRSSDSPSKVDNFPPLTNGSSRGSLGYKIPSGISKEQDDTLKQYQEVGQGQRSYGRIEDINSAFSIGKGKSSYLDRPSTAEPTMEDLEAETKVQVDEDLSDPDFAISLDDEYFMGRAESLHANSREKSLFINLVISSFVSCIVIF